MSTAAALPQPSLAEEQIELATRQPAMDAPTNIETIPEPRNVVSQKETWRQPWINRYRIMTVFLTLFNIGVHEAAWGPLIPLLEDSYDLTYTTVSLVFLAAFPGYILAATTSDRLHGWIGRRGLAAFASTLRIGTYITIVCRPPWPVVVTFLVFCGWGNGLLDSAWNAWTGNLNAPNQLLGIGHAFFGLGATCAPILASAMVTKYGLPWNYFYSIPLGLACLELICGVTAFWSETGAEYRRKQTESNSNARGRTRTAMTMRSPWTVAMFLLVYGGIEVSLGGWIVTFMTRIRHSSPFDSSMVSTGFWLGITMGRLALAFVTPKIGERWSIIGYLVIGLALQLVFWLVPHFIVSAVSVSMLGFVLGPMFPAAVVAVSKLLPKHLHIVAMSFTSAIGMGGAAALPFAVGAVAAAAGVETLQPIVLGLIVVLLLVWLSLPKIPKDGHEE